MSDEHIYLWILIYCQNILYDRKLPDKNYVNFITMLILRLILELIAVRKISQTSICSFHYLQSVNNEHNNNLCIYIYYIYNRV